MLHMVHHTYRHLEVSINTFMESYPQVMKSSEQCIVSTHET